MRRDIVFIFVLAIALTTMVAVIASSSSESYYWWYPSNIPANFQELQQVKLAYAARTREDEEFYRKTDRNLASEFHDILNGHVSLKEIENAIVERRLVKEIMDKKNIFQQGAPVPAG